MWIMTDITRSYRIRAYPNGAQRRLLDRWLGGIRWLWNTTVEIRSAAYRECGLTLTGNDLTRWLTQWKRTSGHEWLAEIPATALTQCLRDQDSAFRNFSPSVRATHASSASNTREVCDSRTWAPFGGPAGLSMCRN